MPTFYSIDEPQNMKVKDNGKVIGRRNHQEFQSYTPKVDGLPVREIKSEGSTPVHKTPKQSQKESSPKHKSKKDKSPRAGRHHKSPKHSSKSAESSPSHKSYGSHVTENSSKWDEVDVKGNTAASPLRGEPLDQRNQGCILEQGNHVVSHNINVNNNEQALNNMVGSELGNSSTTCVQDAVVNDRNIAKVYSTDKSPDKHNKKHHKSSPQHENTSPQYRQDINVTEKHSHRKSPRRSPEKVVKPPESDVAPPPYNYITSHTVPPSAEVVHKSQRHSETLISPVAINQQALSPQRDGRLYPGQHEGPPPGSGPSSPDSDTGSIYHQPLKDVDVPSAQRLAKRLYILEGFQKKDISKHLSKK
jgi:hypothetical protein